MSQKEFASVVFDSYILSFNEVGDMIKYYSNELLSSLPYKRTLRVTATPTRRCSRFNLFYAGTPRGRWKYNSSCGDRIHFTVNKPVKLHGVQHFGSDGGEYTVSTEVKDSTDGSILVKKSGSFLSAKADTDCYYSFDVQFDRPVCLVESREYELLSLIKGPASWYGDQGQQTVESQGVQFTFRNSDGRRNGTCVARGQFPSLYIG